MSDIKQARGMWHLAARDLAACMGMLSDFENFADSVFGFHAQQAVEKLLKAWLALLGVNYPLTHKIDVLLDDIESAGWDVTAYVGFVELTSYAVILRYSYDDDDEAWINAPLDRPAVVRDIQSLSQHVEQLLAARTPS